MQGVLAHAENGDKLFWEEKFHATNGKARACTQGALLFFLLSFGGGRGGQGIFSFFLASQCVPTTLHSSSQWVPNMFPNLFFIAPHFYPICFGKCCPPFTYIGAPKGMNSILQDRTFYFGEPP